MNVEKLFVKFEELKAKVNKYVDVKLPNNIQLVFCSSGTSMFPTMDNAGVYVHTNKKLYMNLDWSLIHVDDDYQSIIVHELRHCIQNEILDKVKEGKIINDVNPQIKEWRKNFKNYIRFVTSDPEEIHIKHFLQPVELDAYAFAIALFKKENLDAYFRLPEKCEEEINKLAVTIYNKF